MISFATLSLRKVYKTIEIGDLIKIKENNRIGLILEKRSYNNEFYFIYVFKNGKKQWLLFRKDRFYFFPKT